MSGKSLKTIGLILCLFVLAGIFRACASIFHEHEWQEATCTTARTCAKCGQTDGEPLGHQWVDATCQAPKTCSVCGATEGGRADHIWLSATCIEPEMCSVCGKNRHWYSVPLGHEWQEATCNMPQTCVRCGATEGTPQHDLISYYWDTTVEPTCQSEGEAAQACRTCGEVVTKVLPVVVHKAGDWEVVEEATPTSDGTKAQYCVWCGLEIGTRSYTNIAPSGGSGCTTAGSQRLLCPEHQHHEISPPILQRCSQDSG